MTGLLKWINFSVFLTMIIVNALANLIPLGGHTTGEVSAGYPNLFTPAPFTFAIWGVIYLLMGFYSIMQLNMSDTNTSLARVHSSIGILFILSCVFNIAWVFSWHFSKIGLSVICMLLLLATLICINLRLTLVPDVPLWERLTVYGFNIYLGWISVATIANIAVFLVKVNWSGFGIPSIIWTICVIAVGALIGVGFAMIGQRYFAAGAMIWAYFGIVIKHISSSNASRSFAVAVSAMIAIAIILAFMIVSAILPSASNGS